MMVDKIVFWAAIVMLIAGLGLMIYGIIGLRKPETKYNRAYDIDYYGVNDDDENYK